MPEQTHDDIRHLLEHVAQDAPAFAPAKEHTVRRARRRVATNLVTASLVAATLFATVVFGLRALPGQDGAPPVSDLDLPVELYGVNIESGDLTPFVRLPEGASDFALSSDANRIAFVLDIDGYPQIFVMNADGSGPVQLTHEPLAALAPAWSPSASEIAYRALAPDTSYEIIVIDLEAGTRRRLTHEDQDVSHSLAWTPDGDSILYQTSIWKDGAVDATQVVRSVHVTTEETSTILTGACCPDPSPDGTRIAYNTWSRALVTVTDNDGSALGSSLPRAGSPRATRSGPRTANGSRSSRRAT